MIIICLMSLNIKIESYAEQIQTECVETQNVIKERNEYLEQNNNIHSESLFVF